MSREKKQRYRVGMYGGSFDPLHVGHIHDIIRAAAMCEELYVMISWCPGRESTGKELRYRWILNSTRHLDNVRIFLLEDEAQSKEEYNTDYYWEKGAQDIKALIGKPINIVFCGTDYLGTNRFESLYCPESTVHYFDRAEVPVSSTDIRTWATKNWDYIPRVCKDYYARKVLVVGGESTGKSTLVQNLALAFNTNFVAEVGRDTCAYAGGEEYMIAEDLYENILRQRTNVMDAAKEANRILFVDTDAITTLFYSYLLLGENSADNIGLENCVALAEAVNRICRWDLVLFLEPDVEFIQDGTRNPQIEENRKKYSNQIKELLKRTGITYYSISGSYVERFNRAKKLIQEKLAISTQW